MDGNQENALNAADNPTDQLNFRRRWTGVELMDDPKCDEAMLLRTIDQFTSINRLVSRYRSILSRLVLDDMKRDPSRKYHLIDLGAGGCDIPVWLLAEAARRRLKLRVTALDADSRIAAHAVRRHGHVDGLTIVVDDLTAMARYGPSDYVFANHVLHHLPDAIIPSVLRSMQIMARRRWIVSDLTRSRWAYLGFQALGRFYRNSFTFEDGKRSIRRGFITADARHYFSAPDGPGKGRILRLIPGRMVWHGMGIT